MPTPSSHSPFSQAPLTSQTRKIFLAQLFLAFSFGAIGLLFGLVVWRLMHLPRSAQPAVQYQAAPSRPVTPPRPEVVVESTVGLAEMVPSAPPAHPNSGEEKQRRQIVPKAAILDAPARLPETLTAKQDVEQRLRASEDDLRSELSGVPELRLLSDLDVKNVRKAEHDSQKPIIKSSPADPEAARAELIAAQEELRAAQAKLRAAQYDLRVGRMSVFAYDGAARAYQKVVDRYTKVVRRCMPEIVRKSPQEQEQIGYDSNLRLHHSLERAAIQEGLALRSGPQCQLDPSTAADVAKISKELRDQGFVAIPGAPRVTRNKAGSLIVDNRGGRIGGMVIKQSGVFVNGARLRPSDEKAEDKTEAFQTWCDQHGLEVRRGTVPTLTQLLQIENEATRLLLVRELIRSRSDDAATQLAVRAIMDISPTVREAALGGLEQRPSSQYLPVLLQGLRYPWPPVADHAAVALRKLKPQEAVASLVDLLDLPSPSAPVFDAKTQQYKVWEMVRLNHLRNCLLCHAPSANKGDGLVRGLVPTPGQPLPFQYYESQRGDFVRADMTFLRQDFSVNLPVQNAAPWPNEQRFDFVTRLRTVSSDELTDLLASAANYPQRESVLYALRGLTGKDGGVSSALWRELLGPIAEKPKEIKKSSALQKITVSPTQTKGPR